MKALEQWNSSTNQLIIKNASGIKIRNSFVSLLKHIHSIDWEGACHASSTILYSLLAAQGIEADIYLGEVYNGKIYFDHSWVEVNGEIYDAAISLPLIEDFYFPPVFRGIDLSTMQPSVLCYGMASGLGYEEIAQQIRLSGVSEYMSNYPDHPQGLYGIAKIVGKAAGIRVNIKTIQKSVENVMWKERPTTSLSQL